MSTEIYYFSGTGNSLYIAGSLQSRMPGAKLLPIAGLLRSDTIRTNADTIGLVFPIQGPTFPNAVKRFLQKADFATAKYIFAVATRGGTTCRTDRQIDKILRGKGKRLDAHFVITVFNNDPKLKSDGSAHGFHIPSREELRRKESEIEAKLDAIREIVAGRESCHTKDTEYTYRYGRLLEWLILFAIRTQEKKGIQNYFYTDANCIGCGLCETVCLSGKIEMQNGKPHWRDDTLCYMCYACLNYCPKESVQIHSKWYMKSYTAVHGRYPHPYAAAGDIAKQKQFPLPEDR